MLRYWLGNVISLIAGYASFVPKTNNTPQKPGTPNLPNFQSYANINRREGSIPIVEVNS